MWLICPNLVFVQVSLFCTLLNIFQTKSIIYTCGLSAFMFSCFDTFISVSHPAFCFLSHPPPFPNNYFFCISFEAIFASLYLCCHFSPLPFCALHIIHCPFFLFRFSPLLLPRSLLLSFSLSLSYLFLSFLFSVIHLHFLQGMRYCTVNWGYCSWIKLQFWS